MQAQSSLFMYWYIIDSFRYFFPQGSGSAFHWSFAGLPDMEGASVSSGEA